MKTTKQSESKGLVSRSELLSTDKAIDGTGVSPTTTEQAPAIDFSQRNQNRTLSTDQVLHLVSESLPEVHRVAQIVGKWVWVHFSDAPAGEVRRQLAQLGFHWNRKRQSWQHPCGLFRSGSTGDPRGKYQSIAAAKAQVN